VLEGLKRIGYDAVEPFLPDYGDDPKAFRRRIDAAGLYCSGFHMPLDGLVNEPQRFIDIALTIGDRPLMIPPFLMPADRPHTRDGWRRVGDKLRHGAELAGAHGLTVAWHNHDYEYGYIIEDGGIAPVRPIDLMLESAGDKVGLEIDFAWVTRGWKDPKAELERYAERIVAIQLKDTASPGVEAEGGWTATGDGIVRWKEIWPLFRRTRADHLVVEHDNPSDWKVVAKRSFDFAKDMERRST
jgi:sugar phosphate isomerase/epimerase